MRTRLKKRARDIFTCAREAKDALKYFFRNKGKRSIPCGERRFAAFCGYSPKSLIFNCETIWYNCLTINFETFLKEER